MDWDSYRYFLALYRRKSLKLAAKDLGVNQTTVGRRISALESELAVKLFEKRSNGFFSTLAGDRVLELAEQIESQFLQMERQVLGRDQRLHGVVRLAMPGALANHFIIPRMAGFCEKYPELEVQFLTGPEVLNLSRREADLAIRLVRPQQSELVVRKVGSLELAFYCVKTQLKNWNLRERTEKDAAIPLVHLFERATSRSEQELLNQMKVSLITVLRSAAWSSVFAGVKAGIGVGVLPSFMGDYDSNLVRCSDNAITVPLWLVVHPEVNKSARVRVLMDFLNSALGSL